jgi:predicted nuclease of restriction endonuclease-like (RecB) superfamily
MIRFYWTLGTDLIEKQGKFKWGDGFLEQFSKDIRNAFPEMQGFSVSNLKRMRLYAQEYPEFEKSPQLVSQLPWGHISVLIHKIKDIEQREWYAKKTIEHGWSRAVLEMHIETDLFNRQADPKKKITNYPQLLPSPQSDLAIEILKDPYKFDFLTVHEDAHEREIENAMIANIKDFLLELGQGFAFVGSQVPLTFDDQEFFLDLLFYHLKLRSFVVCEIKSTKFKPEHTAQLGFYLAAVDEQIKQPEDNRTIGILLCKSKNKVVAEFALKNINAPIGVSEYSLAKALPQELKTNFPTIEELEAKLNETIESKSDE